MIRNALGGTEPLSTFAGPSYQGLFAELTRALPEARQQLVAGNTDRADQMLRTAADNGAPESEIAAVTAEILPARVARPKPAASRPQPAVLPENALRRTRFAPPEYPARARERGTQGWVDIEFTVAADGTTRDAIVRAAEPAGVFDRAALQAVARWRYEPQVIDGIVVDQRVEARLRFELKD